MPKTTFVSGTTVEPAWFNAIQEIAFDGQVIDGHYPRLLNDALSNTPGNVRYDYYSFQGALQVIPATGLIVSYNGGSVTLQDGTIVAIAPSQISLPASSTSYVFVNTSGVVATSTVYPVRCLMLAQVVTNASAIVGSIVDLRPRYEIAPLAQSVRSFGGLGGNGNYTLAATDTLSGEYWFDNFTINVGATLTISGAAYIYVTGNVAINGTINVTAPVRGGPGYKGGLQPQEYPNYAGAGLGGGSSVNSAPAGAYNYFLSPIGSGGAGSFISLTNNGGSIGAITPKGGNGGGALIIECAGTIAVTGAINANGEDGQGNTSVTNLTGGAVTGYTAGVITGGGGGSGGLIWLKSLRSITASAAAQLSVRGGNGGTSYPNPATQSTAGGGGGGYVVCSAPTVNLTGATINLAGGTSAVASVAVSGSVSGGSFGGVGGAAGVAGSVGQLVTRNIIPL